MAVKWGGGRFFRFTKNGINKTGKKWFKNSYIYIGHDQSSIDSEPKLFFFIGLNTNLKCDRQENKHTKLAIFDMLERMVQSVFS